MARVVELKTAGITSWSKYAKDSRNSIWLLYANEFHNTANKTGSPIVQAFLLGRAFELYFKTFLFSRGYGETSIKKKFGHNLKMLLDEAILNGLDKRIHISSNIHTDIINFNSVYTSKAFEYFSILYLIKPPNGLPDLGRLLQFAGRLKKFLKTHIHKPV